MLKVATVGLILLIGVVACEAGAPAPTTTAILPAADATKGARPSLTQGKAITQETTPKVTVAPKSILTPTLTPTTVATPFTAREETTTPAPVPNPTPSLTPTATPFPAREETPTLTPVLTPTPPPTPSSSFGLTSDSSTYDGKTVELSGQTYLTDNPPRLLIDGKSGVNITGNTAALQKGFYRLKGVYDADANILDVAESIEEEARYLAIEAAKELGINIVPVAVRGLIATTPKEVATMLTSYLSIPNFPQDVPIYPYVVYARDGFYLALSDTPVHLPAEVNFRYKGKEYYFTFSSGELKGTLVKTPLERINFGSKWKADEFGGVIIAESIRASDPVSATVRQISNDPESFAFKRVSIQASYLVATATVDYSEIKVPFGVGILADSPTELFFEEQGPRLETIDPDRKTWQLRQAEVIGTVLYPTEEILQYLNYSTPLSSDDVMQRVKPALIVDTLMDDVVKVAEISELNPVTGNPQRYWGTATEFDGYALGVKIPLKDVVEAIAQIEIPINVNVLAIGIADSPTIGSQVAIIGLNNELLDQGGETIVGRFKFRVAVTEMPVTLVDSNSADTAFFLLSKEELTITAPTLESIAVSPASASINVGSTQRFTASGTYSDGSTQDITALVVWTSSNPTVATPGAGGLATGVSAGTAAITATLGTAQGSASLTVQVFCALDISVDPPALGVVAPFPLPFPDGTHLCGTAVVLTAVPAPFYVIDHWSGDASGNLAVVTVIMDADKGVTAHFKSIF